MPSVFIQIGDVGNQIGEEFWKLALSELESRKILCKKFPSLKNEFTGDAHGLDSIFHEEMNSLHPRSVMITSDDNKYLSYLNNPICDSWKEPNLILNKDGNGQNWAAGYNKISNDWTCKNNMQLNENGNGYVYEHDKQNVSFFSAANSLIRKEVEKSDFPVDFVILNSYLDNSDSGLSSRMLEYLRNDYGNNYILNYSLLPNYTIINNKNYALDFALSSQFLQSYCDGVVLFQTNDLENGFQNYNSPYAHRDHDYMNTAKKMSNYEKVNYVSRCLTGSLFPISSFSDQSLAEFSPVRDLISTLCPDPSMKFLEMRTSPLNPIEREKLNDFFSIFQSIDTFIPKFDALDKNHPITSLSSMSYCRGYYDAVDVKNVKHESLEELGNLYSPLSSSEKFLSSRVSLISKSSLFSSLSKEDSFLNQKSITVASNRSNTVGLFNTMVEKSKDIIQSGYGIKDYERFGCSKVALEDALESCLNIADSYRFTHGHP